MLRHLIVYLLSLPAIALTAAGASPVWSGAAYAPVSVTPVASSGLNAVYVVRSTDGVSVSFTPQGTPNSLVWYRFGALGAAYAEPVVTEQDGTVWTLRNVEPDTGYMIECDDDPATRYFFWVTDWSAAPFDITSLKPGTNDCTATELDVAGSAGRLTYTSINGRQTEIDRAITVSYTSLSYDEENGSYAPVTVSEQRAWLPERLSLPAPLCETEFTVNGDRFLREWGEPVSVTSTRVRPVAIDAHTEAEQTEHNADNEQKTEGSELGGSAPAEVTFRAAVTDAAIFTEWQISADPEFDLIDFRSSDPVTVYTFREAGTSYVRFMAANDDASCEYMSDTYTVFVGESDMKIPNAFSPGASEGVNDIWKVSYKSIVSFDCHIFNKWGEELYHFSDPAQGWDGKYRGKTVPAGVYYYVIKATGADGRNWDRAGDINIVNYR